MAGLVAFDWEVIGSLLHLWVNFVIQFITFMVNFITFMAGGFGTFVVKSYYIYG